MICSALKQRQSSLNQSDFPGVVLVILYVYTHIELHLY